MHNQVLVIYPKDVELDDIMYWYQEVDKTQKQKMVDERCQFLLEIPEEKIPSVLNSIKEKLEKNLAKYGEMIQYRSKHSLKEFKEKYNREFKEYIPEIYVSDYNNLKEYWEIKDLPIHHPRQIKLIKEEADIAADKIAEVYIPGRGYGYFDNPYGIWDYYRVVNERRFPPDVCFLIGKTDRKDNQMSLRELDVKKTVDNIHEFTRVWESIIFCEKEADDTLLYTINDIRFKEKYGNEHCRVEELPRVLQEIKEKYGNNDEYTVIALDYHW